MAISLKYDWSTYIDGLHNHELRLPKCVACGDIRWYPTPVCENCLSTETQWIVSSGKGELYSWAVVDRAFISELKDELPVMPAIVKLEEGPRFVTRMIDCDPSDLHLGDLVEVAFRDSGESTEPLFRKRQ